MRPQYLKAPRAGKKVMLDNFVAATGLSRKHAIALFSADGTNASRTRQRSKKYDDVVQEALLILWEAANRICSKRFVPFLPELIDSLERFGHLNLTDDVRFKLLSLSAATADRILHKERKKYGRSRSLTKPGYLIKKQIEVRTFADWNDVTPGFLEADLVAHCGDNVHGQFLNTLTLTDIATGWTELGALLRRSEADVLKALEEAKLVLPFGIQGIDTDNGSEFINYEILGWCENNKVTFTRSREYRKNDQAHVEEKNGSIVRRLIGYDRFEGNDAWLALSEFYQTARLYINYFQPCLKLKSKERDGARVRKKYLKAETPLQRLMNCPTIPAEVKTKLCDEFRQTDPIKLIKAVERLQKILLNKSVNNSASNSSARIISISIINPDESQAAKCATGDTSQSEAGKSIPVTSNRPKAVFCMPSKQEKSKQQKQPTISGRPMNPTATKVKPGRSTKFDALQQEIESELASNPSLTARGLLQIFMERYPGRFRVTQRSTLHSRILKWRMSQLQISSSRNDEEKNFRVEPNWERIRISIKKGITREHIFRAYRDENKDKPTYGYSQFCRRFFIWLETSGKQTLEPDWEIVHSQVENGATKLSLWQEYEKLCRQTDQLSHTYNNYCRRYNVWISSRHE
jgi:hypothetical protein